MRKPVKSIKRYVFIILLAVAALSAAVCLKWYKATHRGVVVLDPKKARKVAEILGCDPKEVEVDKYHGLVDIHISSFSNVKIDSAGWYVPAYDYVKLLSDNFEKIKVEGFEKYRVVFLDNVVSSPEHNRVLAEYRNYNEDVVSDSFFYADIDVTLEYHEDISYDKITHLEIGERNINDTDFMFLKNFPDLTKLVFYRDWSIEESNESIEKKIKEYVPSECLNEIP